MQNFFEQQISINLKTYSDYSNYGNYSTTK
jgi:hypothetical protein